jgi:membrane protein DedA with SNARE-associated domain
VLGRCVGRRVVTWGGWGKRRRRRWLDEAEDFFQDWGAASVVVGRWLPVARFTVAWLAGISHVYRRRRREATA